MHDIVVKISRTIANDERLRVLGYLIAHGECAPTKLTAELKLAPNVLSSHLAKLATAGLMTRRRSGSWSFCRAESPYREATLSGQMFAWLHGALADPAGTLKHCGLREVRNDLSAEAAAGELRRLLFRIATAFTDVRRVQLLLLLASGKPMAAETICKQLHMSVWALLRHADKLIRRGYLTAQTTNDITSYQLAQNFPTTLHASAWKIIERSLRKASLRTSRSPQ